MAKTGKSKGLETQVFVNRNHNFWVLPSFHNVNFSKLMINLNLRIFTIYVCGHTVQCSNMHIQQKSQILGLGHFLDNLCYVTMRELHFWGFWGLMIFLSSYFWLLCPVFHKFHHFHKGNFTKYEKYPICTDCHSFWAQKSLLPRGNKS